MYRYWWCNDVFHRIYQCQKLQSLVALSLSVIYWTLTRPLIRCCEFPRCDPFFEIILELSLFRLFRHAALYPLQVAFESKTRIRLMCFCILQRSQVKSLVTEIVVWSQYFDNICAEKIPTFCLDLLSYLTIRVHLCATYLFTTNFFGKYIVISDMIYFKRIYVDYL